jgi:hypothetical protein
MKTPRNHTTQPFDDIEMPYHTVADDVIDGIPVRPLVVRLGDLWTDLVRAPQESDAAVQSRPASALPLIDDMKGILQWD